MYKIKTKYNDEPYKIALVKKGNKYTYDGTILHSLMLLDLIRGLHDHHYMELNGKTVMFHLAKCIYRLDNPSTFELEFTVV